MLVRHLAAMAAFLWLGGCGTPWSPPPFDGVVPGEVDAADLAARVAAYIAIPTVQPAGPDGLPTVTLEDGTTRPAWLHHLVTTEVEPLGLRWAEVHGGLAIFVDTDDTRPPILWLSHADVVPVAADEVPRWTHPPFDGVVADGFVWGRGALDNKASTLAQLAAIRWAREAGVSPSRDLVLLVTPDEEVGGETAGAVAADLASIGHPEAVIDEGSYLLPDLFPGQLVAAVAVAEKTYATFELVARADGGHSSMPKGAGAIDVLAEALARVEAWETPSAVPPDLAEGLTRVASTQAFPTSLALAHPQALSALVLPSLQKSPGGNAVSRDTVVATMLSAGVKDNVIPSEARAVLNARLRPETDPDAFLAELTAVVADPRVEVVSHPWNARGGIASWTSPTFRALETAVPAVVPEAIVIPSRTPATMDARHFAAAGLDAYRFHPFEVDASERGRLHGLDERLAVDQLARAVRVYGVLLQTL